MISVFLVSTLATGMVVVAASRSVLLTRRGDLGAVQAAHTKPTPRLGGLAIFLSLAAAPLLVEFVWSAPFLLLVFAAMPIAGAGLAEDMGLRLSPRARLGAAAVSSALAVILLSTWIRSVDLPAADLLLGMAPIGIVFTIFAVTGVANAFNLIDGINGLSAGVAVLVGLGMAVLTVQTGHSELSEYFLVVVLALAGFLLFNFPKGWIFLGDSGAYTVGFMLAWLSVVTLNHVPEVTAWAILLIFFWPVADTMLAIFRRVTAGKRSDQPDRLHFHQLVMRALEIFILGPNRRNLSNPIATLVILPLAAAPVVAGVMFWDAELQAACMVGVFAGLFSVSYFLGIRGAKTLLHHRVHADGRHNGKRRTGTLGAQAR